MRSFLVIVFLMIASVNLSRGQNRQLSDAELNASTASKIAFVNAFTCDQIDDWVKSDINKKTILLFLQGGIAPIQYTTDKDFQNKYGIYFYDFGCSGPDKKCVSKYNQTVFDYLTSTFGKKWRKEIRKDVIGLSKWKPKKPA